MSTFKDENIGKPVNECPGYVSTHGVEYDLDGEQCTVIMHAFEDGAAQFNFKRGDTKQGIALTAMGLLAMDVLRGRHRERK